MNKFNTHKSCNYDYIHNNTVRNTMKHEKYEKKPSFIEEFFTAVMFLSLFLVICYVF